MEDVFDLPFYYVFNAVSLADGQSYDGLTVSVDSDAEFRLRAVLGTHLVCSGGIYLYDGQNRPMTPNGFVHPGNQPLLVQPEVVYPKAGQIRFNLSNVQRARFDYTGAQRAYYSRLAFAGVKRFRGQAARSMVEYQKSDSKFRHAPFWVSNTFSVTIASHIGPGYTVEESPRQFRADVDNYGYDWFALGADPVLVQNKLLLMPYDATGVRQLASDFLPSSLLSWQGHRPWACFPPTPLYFPSNSLLRIDWMSRFTDTDTLPQSVSFTLLGARRIPC